MEWGLPGSGVLTPSATWAGSIAWGGVDVMGIVGGADPVSGVGGSDGLSALRARGQVSGVRLEDSRLMAWGLHALGLLTPSAGGVDSVGGRDGVGGAST